MKKDSLAATTVVGRVTEIQSECRRSNDCRDKHQLHAARKIGPVIDYMLQHLNKPLRISALSATAGFSVSHFHSLFKSATGWAPIDFFIRLRVQRACSLLRNKNLRIKEIATLLGYDDPYYFSRSFKVVTGLAPGHYRNRILDSMPGKSDWADAGGKQANRHVRFWQFAPSKKISNGDSNGSDFYLSEGHFRLLLDNALSGNIAGS